MKNPNGGRPLTEYALSIDCAKENQDYERFDNFIKTGGRLIEYALALDCNKI